MYITLFLENCIVVRQESFHLEKYTPTNKFNSHLNCQKCPAPTLPTPKENLPTQQLGETFYDTHTYTQLTGCSIFKQTYYTQLYFTFQKMTRCILDILFLSMSAVLLFSCAVVC